MAEKKTVWMRAEEASPQERQFTEEHAKAILEFEKEKGIKLWRRLKAPTKNGKDPEFESD